MPNFTTVELKAFLPAQDFNTSKRFYQDLGFKIGWSNEGMAYVSHGKAAFLLQNFYMKDFAEHLMMHLLVEDVDSWWEHVQGVLIEYGMKSEPPKDRSWGIRDFAFLDPSGVAWRIGRSTE